MTEFVCVTGTVIELKAGVTWGWGTSVATTTPLPVPNVNTFFGNTKDITITGTGVKLTVDTKNQ